MNNQNNNNNIKSHIDHIIDFYYKDDPDHNLISHAKLAELITLIYIAFNGHNNIRAFLVKLNEKCGKGYLEVVIDSYVEMINNGQIELYMAVKELFTVDDLNIYGL